MYRQLDLFGQPLPHDAAPNFPVSEPDSDASYDSWPENRRAMDELAEVGS